MAQRTKNGVEQMMGWEENPHSGPFKMPSLFVIDP